MDSSITENKYYMFVLLLGISTSIHAYEVDTHARMTLEAYENSILNTINFEAVFGVQNNQLFQPRNTIMNNQGYFLPAVNGSGVVQEKSAKNIIEYGSIAEDDETRPFNHFLDPQHGNKKLLPGISTDNSVNWSLEDQNTDISGQWFSLSDAQDFYLNGIIQTKQEDRVYSLGLMFQSIGHVVHHIQDMAQPQHVRDDMHCNHGICLGLELLTGTLADIHQPSAYEDYSKQKLTVNKIKSLFDQSYYSVAIDYKSSGFVSPRDYWLKTNTGMAVFTSENFVTVDTHLRNNSPFPLNDISLLSLTSHEEFPLPDGSDVTVNKRALSGADLCGGGAICNFNSGIIYFLSRNIYDPVTQQDVLVDKFSTFGLFDDELIKIGMKPVWSMNRFNYESRWNVLIPRAVGFSAGLINHFFRGAINVSSPKADDFRFTLSDFTGQSSNTIFNGTVSLYYDNSNTDRVLVPGATWDVNWTPSQGEISRTFTYPSDANGNFVLVFNGTIDNQASVASKFFSIASPADETPSCGQPLQPSGGQGTNQQFIYNVSNQIPQTLDVFFEAFRIPDALTVTANGQTLVNTNGQVSGFNQYAVSYDPNAHGSNLTVTVNAPNSGTAWNFCVNCQGSGTACSNVTSRKRVYWSFNLGSFWKCSGTPRHYFDGKHTTGKLYLSPGNHRYTWDGTCFCTSGGLCGPAPKITIDGATYPMPSGSGGINFTTD